MGIRKFRPMTPGTRRRSVSDFAEVTRGTPEKSLLEPLTKSGGRNNHGHLTMRHRGGGHKRRYRRIDFKRQKFGVPARVAQIEYDPNRTARIALLTYAAVIAPVLSSFDPNVQTDLLGAATLAPSLQHPFGTDFYSRDLFSRMLYGARWSLGIAFVAVTLVVVVGTSVGVIAGVTGGIVDSVLMRMVDGGLAIPRVLLLLVVAALWGNLGFFPLAVQIGRAHF